MDHKVSKDMISSGMIPSGEKTQADLSRTQYGSAPSPSSLMDAYRSQCTNIIKKMLMVIQFLMKVKKEKERINELKVLRIMLDELKK